jgi:hypothetical protein
MGEWTVHIGTLPGSVHQDQALRMATILEEAPGALGPAVGFHPTGVASATYQVEAAEYADAVGAGVALFFHAQIAAGVDPTMGTLTVTTDGRWAPPESPAVE